jgi:hypothetical protein
VRRSPCDFKGCDPNAIRTVDPGVPASRTSTAVAERRSLSASPAACPSISPVRRKRVEAPSGNDEYPFCRAHVDARSSGKERQTMNARIETFLFSVTAVLIVVLMVGGLQDIVAPSASSPATSAVVQAASGQPGDAAAAGAPASGAAAAPRG